MFLFSELVALRVECVNFQSNQVDVRVHGFGNLLNIIPIFYVLNNRIVRERSLRCKKIGFIFHTVFTHIKNIKFLKSSGQSRFLPMEHVMPNLVPEDDLFNYRVQTVLKKNKAVLQDNFVCSTLLFEIPVKDIDAKFIGDSVWITSAAFLNQFIHDCDNLILCVISHNGSPPSSAIITDSSTIPYDKTYAVL